MVETLETSAITAESAASDAELLERYQRTRNQDAFRALYERHYGGLVQSLYLRYGDFHHAEDVAQQAFLNVSLHADQFNSAYSFRTWLFRIAEHASVSMYRLDHSVDVSSLQAPMTSDGTPTAIGNLPSREVDPLQVLLQNERDIYLAREVRALAPNYRAIIERHYFHDQTCRAFAGEQGILESTVRWRLREALRYMRMYIRTSPVFMDDALRAA
jgi:RNA polymerase sigma-70 factor (ECF subfamily)